MFRLALQLSQKSTISYAKWSGADGFNGVDVWMHWYRVPQPYPTRVFATLFEVSEAPRTLEVDKWQFKSDPALKSQPFTTLIRLEKYGHQKCTYLPCVKRGNPITAFYVPRRASDERKFYMLRLEWDLASRGLVQA